MDDERNLQPKSDATRRDDVDDQIDALLPVPSKEATPAAEEIDSSMDTVIPNHGDAVSSSDDATTSEEMEVDTTNDGIDDIIDFSHQPEPDDDPEQRADDRGDEQANDEDLVIAGEPVSWEPVDDVDPESPHNDDNHPINEDSEFFTSSYVPFAPTGDDERVPGKQSTSTRASIESESGSTEANSSHRCSACGADTGSSPFCPQCGTDQYPSSRLGTLLQPLLSWSRPLAIRAILFAGGLFILLALLSDSGTTALIISAVTIPLVLLARIRMQLSDHARSGWIQVGMVAFVGLVIGLPLAWFGARMVIRQWFDTGVLNFGAAGYGGNFAEAAGVAPFFVWLVVGLLIPVVVILAICAIPVALKMALNMPPKESTGMILSGAVAAGYVIASGIVFYSPLYDQLMPRMSTSQWTLTIFGLAVVRPIVWILGGSMLGAIVWRYLRTASPASIMLPAVIAGVLVIGYSILSLASSPAGHWAETVVGILFAVAAIFFYHRFMETAIRNDDATSVRM